MVVSELLRSLNIPPALDNQNNHLNLPMLPASEPELKGPGTETKLVQNLYSNLSDGAENSAKQRLANIADHSPIALVCINNEGSVFSANKACKSVIGIPSSILMSACLYDYLTTDSAQMLNTCLLYTSPSPRDS